MVKKSKAPVAKKEKGKMFMFSIAISEKQIKESIELGVLDIMVAKYVGEAQTNVMKAIEDKYVK